MDAKAKGVSIRQTYISDVIPTNAHSLAAGAAGSNAIETRPTESQEITR